MAVTDLHTPPTESQRLYAAWRRARAQWDLARYDEAYCGDDLPEDVDARLCSADQAALMSYLLSPADDLGELGLKLRVIEEEGAHEFDRAGEIITALKDDVHRLNQADMLKRPPVPVAGAARAA